MRGMPGSGWVQSRMGGSYPTPPPLINEAGQSMHVVNSTAEAMGPQVWRDYLELE